MAADDEEEVLGGNWTKAPPLVVADADSVGEVDDVDSVDVKLDSPVVVSGSIDVGSPVSELVVEETGTLVLPPISFVNSNTPILFSAPQNSDPSPGQDMLHSVSSNVSKVSVKESPQ